MRDKYDLSACVDCAVALANGEYPEDAEARAEVERGLKEWDSHGFDLFVAEGGSDFSKGGCEVCGSRLHGARMNVAALRRF